MLVQVKHIVAGSLEERYIYKCYLKTSRKSAIGVLIAVKQVLFVRFFLPRCLVLTYCYRSSYRLDNFLKNGKLNSVGLKLITCSIN